MTLHFQSLLTHPIAGTVGGGGGGGGGVVRLQWPTGACNRSIQGAVRGIGCGHHDHIEKMIEGPRAMAL